ncbi:extracellular solute-binding protein [Streptomyces doebereineriae]|uniref:Extracellular solute-binding protein n=1 Tax=Streptomyces doebereineriae TaxID=3075528 RepID=A0ABU2VQL9_9ACTN|nr:extracellular solute-binding protein [Streptomyces sp. DSM 41640]MDT0487911.1 extracellular solute-binding protein [Streptomyces sp. DSM 41640]
MPVSSRGSLDRRRFLAASAGAALSAAALPGCAASVDSGSGAKGAEETLTIMDVAWPKKDKQNAEQALGMNLDIVTYDITKLNAMLAGKNPPDVVRGVGATDVPYFAARDLMSDLDAYFAKSDVLKPSDLAPANDVWRYDSSTRKQGTGPRYGMAKDYSQDCMFWYRTDMFEAAGLELPSDTEPLSCDEWLDLGKRLVKRRLGKVKVYGLSGTALGGPLTEVMWMAASAGGSLFAEDLATVDFSSPEALKALTWYLDYAKADIGPSVVNPNPDGWDWPTYQANRMAMATDGYWFGGTIGGDAKIAEVSRFAPAPQLGSHRISPCFSGTGYWIPKGAKNKDAAWKYFEWYFGGKPARDRATTGWGIPSLNSLRSKMPRDTAFHKQSYEVQQRELPYFSVLPVSPYAQMDALNAVLTKVLPDAVKSGTSAGKVADTLNSRMNEQLARGKELVG